MSAALSTARVYEGPGRRDRPRGPAALPWVFALATIATQIAYPLVDGAWLRRVTIASVVLFFLASVTHALVHRGIRWALTLVVVTAGGGLAAEAVGVRTGLPFGDYTYSASLGPQVLGVPLVVPLAWTMMAYPLFLAARRLSRRWVAVVGGIGLAGWDVFLDPQMVTDGRWRWADPTPGLPGVADVPLTNFAGWLAVGVVMMALLSVALPRDHASETLPATLLFWTYVGSVVGNLLWFGDDAIALAGGLAMGLVVLPYAWALWQSRP
ncbi:MAG: carotenoid biosynthesis protein [Actinomycetes bacterium]